MFLLNKCGMSVYGFCCIFLFGEYFKFKGRLMKRRTQKYHGNKKNLDKLLQHILNTKKKGREKKYMKRQPWIY